MDWTWFCLPLAALPAALGAMNLLRMPRLAPASPAPERLVSILIPARDESPKSLIPYASPKLTILAITNAPIDIQHRPKPPAIISRSSMKNVCT